MLATLDIRRSNGHSDEFNLCLLAMQLQTTQVQSTMRLLLLGFYFTTAIALPTVLITSPKPWCVSVDGALDEALQVEYEAPDLILDRTDKKYAPTYVTIDVKPANRVYETDLHNAPVRENLKPLSELIGERNGKIFHKFEVAGTANVCVRASRASSKAPVAFAFRVETSEEIPEIREATTAKKDEADVDQHLTHMERELRRIQSAMDHVLREADLNKNQDAIFHEQTMAMHSATTFWPIVQVCVLLMTGFTQASHIVRFFKSRRII